MALTYEIDNQLKALAPVLDEHAEWFGLVMRCLFYPEKSDEQKIPAMPESFFAWVKEAEKGDVVERVTLARLCRIHDELGQAATALVQSSLAEVVKPEVKMFDALVDLYDEFVAQLRRLEKDCVQADSGLDVLTGLRSRKAMEKDMERELERRSRRGKPFCLVLARIDNFEDIRARLSSDHMREIVKSSSNLIKKCIRSFDDAYRLSESEFVMALKHADTGGGRVAITRLRGYLQETPIQIENEKGEAIPISLSYCVGEPLPGDNMDELLANMRSDLSRFDEGGDAAVEYMDISPLQRFIHTSDEAEGTA